MRKLKQITFLSLIFISTVAFNFQHNPPSNWYQQFLSIPGSQQINDMTFLDSLTGFIVTSRNVNPDTATIFKTTNGGDNWNVVYNEAPARITRLKFINSNTGFASGGKGTGYPYLYKTTNQGLNWILSPVVTGNIFWDDMSVLNEDTIWCVDKNSLNGGVYRTTNGGVSWQLQFSDFQNPNKIYFYNARIGFITKNSSPPVMLRTSNSGLNWSQVFDEGFSCMYFSDSLTGWKGGEYPGTIAKTTNGGVNWFYQFLPPEGGNFVISRIRDFGGINKDTLWGCGGLYFYGPGQSRGLLYRTTNGGNNWECQIPDSSFHSITFRYVDFTDHKKGWAYTVSKGIHTTLGGDTTFLTDVKQTSTEIPKQYSLSQNYPNPFNPITVISFEIQRQSYVSLKVFDIQGREITTLINENKNAGKYNVGFDANQYQLTSGIYFYKIEVSNSKENFVQTKKMVLVK